MAVFDGSTARARSRGPISGAMHILQSLFAAIAGWNDVRRTRAALDRLSDRELNDIGLCRGDISRMSRRS